VDNIALSGEIPDNIDELFPALQELAIGSSKLHGSIPSSICKLNRLTLLYVVHKVLLERDSECGAPIDSWRCAAWFVGCFRIHN